MNLHTIKYPIGMANIPKQITKKNIEDWIFVLETFPQNLEYLTRSLSDNQLDTPYREKGWSIRQVVHHCYDSHHNSYIRFKWALTEDKPTIKFYYEQDWAELADAKYAPIEGPCTEVVNVPEEVTRVLCYRCTSRSASGK